MNDHISRTLREWIEANGFTTDLIRSHSTPYWSEAFDLATRTGVVRLVIEEENRLTLHEVASPWRHKNTTTFKRVTDENLHRVLAYLSATIAAARKVENPHPVEPDEGARNRGKP